MSELPPTDAEHFRRLSTSCDVVILMVVRDIIGNQEEMGAWLGGRAIESGKPTDPELVERLSSWAWSKLGLTEEEEEVTDDE